MGNSGNILLREKSVDVIDRKSNIANIKWNPKNISILYADILDIKGKLAVSTIGIVMGFVFLCITFSMDLGGEEAKFGDLTNLVLLILGLAMLFLSFGRKIVCGKKDGKNVKLAETGLFKKKAIGEFIAKFNEVKTKN